ncbi:MAG: hypothetical protein WCV92_01635 [Candidatus Buchananbacteria bacterium]
MLLATICVIFFSPEKRVIRNDASDSRLAVIDDVMIVELPAHSESRPFPLADGEHKFDFFQVKNGTRERYLFYRAKIEPGRTVAVCAP